MTANAVNPAGMGQPHPNAALGTEPIRTIGREELKAKIERGEDFKLIMALNRWAYDAKHIPGSIHFDTPDELYAAARPEDEVVVYCSQVDCLSSVALYRDLVRRGYQNVRRYSGGLLDWEDAGLPIEGAFAGPRFARRGSHRTSTSPADGLEARVTPGCREGSKRR